MTARWPYPGDSPLVRARRVAQAYREHLRTANPVLCAAVDDTMLSFGEAWVAPQLVIDEPTDTVTTARAAELLGVRPDTIRRWACTPHPVDGGRRLLPRFGRRGREMTYLVADLYEAKRLSSRAAA